MKIKKTTILLSTVSLLATTAFLYADGTTLLSIQAHQKNTNALSNALTLQPTAAPPNDLLSNKVSDEITSANHYQFNDTTPVLLTVPKTNAIPTTTKKNLDLNSLSDTKQTDYSSTIEELSIPVPTSK